MKKMNVVLLRISTDNQETLSQELAINSYCEQHNITIDKVIRSEGISGFKVPLNDREDLNEIRNLAIEGKLDKLIVFNLDRIGRRLELVSFLNLLDECNVKIISVTEGELNSGQDSDFLINSIKLWVAQTESKKTSVRVKNGKRANWTDTNYVSGKISFGYKIIDKKIVVDETNAEIVRTIFDLYIKYGTSKCVDYLDSLNLKNLNGKKYTRHSVLGMIKNRSYLGIRKSIAYNEEFYVPSLRIIDDYTFRKANEVLESRTIRKNKFVFTNRCTDNKYESLLYHKCYDGTINKLHSSFTYANDIKYSTVVCSHCKHFKYPIRKTYATKKLFEELDKAIDLRLDSLSSDKIESELKEKKSCVIKELELQININENSLDEDKRLLEGLNQTLDKIFKGELKFDLQQILDRVSDTQKVIIEKERVILELKTNLEIEKNKVENKNKLLERFKNFKNIYDLGTDEQKKMVLRELVNRVIIDGNKNITIELKYIED